MPAAYDTTGLPPGYTIAPPTTAPPSVPAAATPAPPSPRYDTSGLPPGYMIAAAPPPSLFQGLSPSAGAPLPSASGQGVGANFLPGKSRVLPVSWDQTGAPRLDPTAGVLGMAADTGRAAVDAATLPHDVYTGQQNVNDPSTIDRAANFAMLASPMTPASKTSSVVFPVRHMPAAPTSDALYAASDAAYARARGLGVDYSSKAVANVAAQAQTAMEADGLYAVNAPRTFFTLKALQSPPVNSVASFGNIESARQSLRRIAQDSRNPDGTPTADAEAAGRAIDAIDGFVSSPDPASVVAGPAADVADIIGQARGNYAAAKRSDRITGIEDAASLRAAAANSGLNGGNAIRSRVVSLLLNPKQLSGFSQDEISALRQVAEGTATQNTLRWVGNFLGGGGGMGSQVVGAIGGVIGSQFGPEGAGIGYAVGPMTGASAKAASNWLTGRAIDNVAQDVRRRSPLYGTPTPVAGPASAAAQAFVARAMADLQMRQQAAQQLGLKPPAPKFDTNGRLIPPGSTIY